VFFSECSITSCGFPLYSVIGDGRQAIANGGIALLSDSQGPLLWNTGKIQRLSFAAHAVNARLNARASTIVYESIALKGDHELHSYDVATGRDLLLATGSVAANNFGQTNYFHASLTGDGVLVAYINSGVVLLVARTDSAGVVQRASATDGLSEADLSEAVISGFGNVAYMATSSGRLIEIDIASGAQTEIFAAPPHIEVTGGAMVPGARLDVAVSGAPPGADPALLSDAVPAPIIARSDTTVSFRKPETTVTFQIPWETSVGSTATIVVPGNPSAFEEVHDFQLIPGIPEFFTLATPAGQFAYAVAAHQDFSGLVTGSSPARAGEIVHFYFTGLGAVAPPIPTGVAAPVGTIYYLKTPLACSFHQGPMVVPASIVFAGLAPTFIGIEQVDMLIPGGFAAGVLQIECASIAPPGFYSEYAQISIAP